MAQHRREIAKLKRQVQEQQKKIAFLEAQERKRLGQPKARKESVAGLRFSPQSVRVQRERLGFSATDYAKLIGISTPTIYNCEQGKSRPQKPQLAALAAVRGIGKREALAKLELLKAKEEKAVRRKSKR